MGEALAGQGLFPAYVTGLVTVGERSGRTEEALNALSAYYEQRDQLDRQVRSALLYPSVLLVLMLVVIVVLLAKSCRYLIRSTRLWAVSSPAWPGDF